MVPDHLIEFAKLACANHDTAHNAEHGIATFNTAMDIIKRDNIPLSDEEWLLLSYVTVGHDFLDYKMKNTLPKETVYEYYSSHVGEELADIITHIHDNCSWSKRHVAIPSPRCDVLRLILQDADRIEGMALRRCFEYTGFHYPELDEESALDRIENIVNEKLIKMYDTLYYPSSKKIADERGYMDELRAFLDTRK